MIQYIAELTTSMARAVRWMSMSTRSSKRRSCCVPSVYLSEIPKLGGEQKKCGKCVQRHWMTHANQNGHFVEERERALQETQMSISLFSEGLKLQTKNCPYKMSMRPLGSRRRALASYS